MPGEIKGDSYEEFNKSDSDDDDNNSFNNNNNNNKNESKIDNEIILLPPRTLNKTIIIDKNIYNENKISRNLSKVLKHDALKLGIHMRRDGYVYIEDLLKLNIFKNSIDNKTINEVVVNNKERFEIKVIDELYYLRCRDGHSIKDVIDDDLLYTKLNIKNIPTDLIVYHITYTSCIDNIISSEGLNKMKRNHIYMYKDIKNIKNGSRKIHDVIITVDIIKAMMEGIVFYISSSNVVVTKGDKFGYLSKEYFVDIEYLKPSLSSSNKKK
jgi:2'-phosphotransferase